MVSFPFCGTCQADMSEMIPPHHAESALILALLGSGVIFLRLWLDLPWKGDIIHLKVHALII